MEKTNSHDEKGIVVIITFVLVLLFLFVLFAQSNVSVQMQTIIADLFTHH